MIHNRPKRIIFASGELGQLQMASEPGFRQCANEDIGLSRRVDCEITHRLERGTKHFL